MQVIELIMPYYEHGSLFDAMHRGELFSVQRAIDLASMTLLGLRELHEVQRVLHRDIKLPNVLLDEGGAARVGDLGLAVPLQADGTAEPFNVPRAWTPPEAFAVGRLDVRSDLYQMGLVVLELFAGPLPYEEERFSRERVARRLSQGHRSLSAANLRPPPWTPPRIRAAIAKATALHPESRFQSAREMGDALRRAAVVDWSITVDEPDRRVWEGGIPRRSGRCFRVDATRRARDGAWRLAARQRVNSWRRLFPDRVVRDLDDRDAVRLFDEIVAIAATS